MKKILIISVLLFIVHYCKAQNSYCIPAPPNGVNGHSINSINLLSLDTTFTGDVYQFIPDSVHHQTCYLKPGSTYQISMKSGTHTSSTLAAWIDWNNDTTLSASEKLGEFVTSSAGQTATISFTVPQNCFMGKLRLRTRASNSTSINACNPYSSGETIDFTITTLNPIYDNNFYPSWDLSNTGLYYIDRVQIGSIDNDKSGGIYGPVYGDYSYLQTDINSCDSYYLYITGNYSSDPNLIEAYIDFNNNGIFEDLELLPTLSPGVGTNTDSIYFTPPAVSGLCRLRIIYSANQQIVEVEDYTLNIHNSPSLAYPAAIIGSDLYFNCDSGCYFYGCVGANIFHDFSCGQNSYRLWTVSGASPSTSTSKNPTFTFANPGVYNIVLKDSNSLGSDEISAQVYIKAPVTNISLGSNTTLCTGDSIQLSAPAGSVSDCFSYLWSTGATTRQIYVRSSGTYSVRVTTCHYYDCPAFDTITVNFTPNVYSVTGGGNYCVGGNGSSVGLSDSQNGISYQLYKNGTAVDTPVTGTGSAINFGLQTSPGTYTIKATSTTPACTKNMTGNAVINVIAIPDTFIVSGTASYCAGGSGVSVKLSGSEVNVNYQLFRNGTAIGSPVAGTGNLLNFPNHTSAGNYTVIATANNSTCTTSMTDSAVISIIPAPPLYTVSGGGSFCGGTENSRVNLSDSRIGNTYELFRNGVATGITLAGTDSSISFTRLLQSGTYTIVATDTGTCHSTMTGNAVLTLSAFPYPYVLTGGGNLCNDSSLDSIRLSGSDTWVRYQLYLDSMPIGNSLNGFGNPLNFGLQTATGTYFVVGSHTITGCYLAMTGRPIIALSHGAPQNDITGGGHFCTGGIGLPIGIDGSDTSFTYQLFLNGVPLGVPLTGTGSALNFGVKNTAGNYTVVATGKDSVCITGMNDTATIVIDPLPSPNITSPIPDTLCTFSSPIALTGAPPGGIFSGDGVLHDTLFPALAGPQTVFVYYDYTDPISHCSTYASDVVLVDICNSIFENEMQQSFSVYPVPADNEIIIGLKLNNQNEFTIELIDETGMTIRKNEYDHSNGSVYFVMNVATISNGIYLLKINSGKSVVSKKIVVSH